MASDNSIIELKLARQYKTFYNGGPISLDTDGNILLCACEDDASVCDIGKATFKTLEGDEEIVTSLIKRPNKPHAIIASRSLQITMWDIASEQPRMLRRWKAHNAPVICMDFDPSGKILATGSADSSIRCWDVERHYCTHHLKGHSGLVTCLHFHKKADQWKLFSGGEDGNIRVWDLIQKKSISILKGHHSVIKSIEVSPCGKYLMSAGRDKVVNIWDLKDYHLEQTIPTYESVESAGFLTSTQLGLISEEEETNYIFTGGDKGFVRVFSLASGKVVLEQSQKDDENSHITDIIFDRINNRLLVSRIDQRLCFLDISDLSKLNDVIGTFDEVLDMKYVGSDSEIMALATPSQYLHIMDSGTQNLCSHSNDKDSTAENSIANVRLLPGHEKAIFCLDADPTGKELSSHNLIATGSKDKTARVWMYFNDEKVGSPNIISLFECVGHTEAVSSIALSTKPKVQSKSESLVTAIVNRFIITASQDRTVKKWDLSGCWGNEFKNTIFTDDYKLRRVKSSYTVKVHEKEINNVEIGKKNKIFGTCSQDKTIKLWNIEDGSLVTTLKGHKRGVWGLSFSHMDNILASSSGDKTIRIWSLNDYTCLRTLEGHSSSILNLQFIQAGNQIISNGSDGITKIWNHRDGECALTLDQHEDKIWACAVSTIKRDDKNLTIISTGGSDASIQTYVDATREKIEQEHRYQEEKILEEQELSNLIHRKESIKAFKLALKLGKSLKCAELITQILESKNPFTEDEFVISEEFDSIIDQLEFPSELVKLLNIIRQINVHTKYTRSSQALLSLILQKVEYSRMLKIPEIKGLIDSILPYTERHLSRMDDLLTESWLLDYTLSEMSILSNEQNEFMETVGK